MGYAFVGLDGEMSGSHFDEGHRLIQIGVAHDADRQFTSDIGWQDEFPYQLIALDVNGFTLDRIKEGPHQAVVDAQLERWLQRSDVTRFIAVGWNVGSFDMPFFRATLPRSAALFSRRTVDLNAVCFTLGKTMTHAGSLPGWTGWKKMAKRAAAEQLGREQWHDAGYDAAASILAWRWLRQRLHPEADAFETTQEVDAE